MTRLKEHSILNFGIHLVITGCLLGILFGQGAHLHNLVVRSSGDLNLNFTVHAHHTHSEDPQEVDHHHSPPKQENDKHHHQIVTFDIDGLVVSPIKVSADLKVQPGIILEEHAASQNIFVYEAVLLLDLPPPPIDISDSNLSSFSFRGPPVA